MRKFVAMLLLFSILSADANITTEGGNVSRVFLNQTALSKNWDGLYGQVVLGAGATQTYTVVGNNISIVDLIGNSPAAGCTVEQINVVATNNTAPTLPLPLSPGDLIQLDELINSSENASNAFTFTDSYQLSVANITGVPSLYTHSYDGLDHFEMGYMNDGDGNIVFVAKYKDDEVDWNNTLSDYQLMLPKGTSNMDYFIWVDVAYTCPPSGGGGGKKHELYIPPISPQSARLGETKYILITIENTGDYTETDVILTIACPASFSCGSANLGTIYEGEEKNATIGITGNETGTFVLKAEGRSDDAYTFREFYFTVLPECQENEECAADEYCDAGECKEKKEINETCKDDYECKTGLCEGMVCVECENSGQCSLDEECVDGICSPIVCECGKIENHTCVPYECCTDEECNKGEVCIEHNCTENEPVVDVVGKNMTEGAYVDVFVMDVLGNPIENAKVYTENMFVYTNRAGWAKIRLPYSGIIYVDALGETVGKYLNITRLAYINIKGSAYILEEVEGNVMDSRNKSIGVVKIFYENKTTLTDNNSVFRIRFETTGVKEIAGKKYGYLVKSATIEVVAPTRVCYFPYLLNLSGFKDNEIFILWALSIILSTINFFMYRKRTTSRFVRAFLYSFGPILLSLPDTWPLSICFMSNIILIQDIYEISLLLRKKMNKKKNKNKG